MSVSVTMPRLGESVSEGTVTRWLKKEGDRVEADEPLLEVSTDKVDTEIPAPIAGVIKTIKVGEDETVEVGAELAVIDSGEEAGASERPTVVEEAPKAEEAEDKAPAAEEEEEAEEEEAEEPSRAQPGAEEIAAEDREERPRAQADTEEEPAQRAAPASRREEAEERPAPPRPSGDGDGGSPAYVTPLVRKLAAERGVDLSTVEGTGVGGRIRKQDVLDAARDGGARAAEAQAPAPAAAERAETPAAAAAPAREPEPAAAKPAAEKAPARAPLRGRTEKLSRLRQVIAQRMTESLQISAQLTTVAEVDVTKIARLRERAKGAFEAREGVKLSFLPFFALACCEALKQHPAVNSSLDMKAGTVTYHDAVHLGIAVDTERGLLVPVIQDAGDLNLGGLARKISDLANRTRHNQVSPDELGGGTFTLTNTGSRGALFDTPIINQPQVGILGTGGVVKRPAVVEDPVLGEVIAVRSMVYLALTYDHRIVDGADAARFLTTLKSRLEAGEFEGELGV